MQQIIKFIDDYLNKNGLSSIDPVRANALLAKAGILRDSADRPGKPLRELLRKGMLPHAYQTGGKGSGWIIPHSGKGKNSGSIGKSHSNDLISSLMRTIPQKPKKVLTSKASIDIQKLKKQLEAARYKYKPAKVKYLLIAEAPPDSLERFFYYEEVRNHDYLFLGVAEALYPKLKDQFIASGRDTAVKKAILQKFKEDGFYLLDLSELPLSLLDSGLNSQIPGLIERINMVREKNTQIIIIKATVYDIVYQILHNKYTNVINQRITFPGQGGQKKFQTEFKQALEMAGYLL